MTEHIDNEELQALRSVVDDGTEQTSISVEPRNFRQPRRLSNARLAHLAKVVGSALPRVCNEMSGPLRGYHKVTLASVSEVNVQQLFTGFKAPFFVYCFDCDGLHSWLVWDDQAAIETVERIIVGPLEVEPEEEDITTSEDKPRVLSQSERKVMQGLLQRLLLPVTEALELNAGDGAIAQEAEELVTYEDAGPDAGPRRLLLHFTFEGPKGSSDLRLFLPGLAECEEEDAPVVEDDTALPDHLDSVFIDLAAYLGSTDVPLLELLSLEVGDVIPLSVEVGSPLQLYAEDRACAKARWGQLNGNLAVQICELDAHPGDIDQPTETA